MYDTLKKIVPRPVWEWLKWPATALGLRQPHVHLTPRDITLLEKWGRDRRALLEIGVFEGGSALILRRVMHPTGTLHLVDPFIPTESDMVGSERVSRVVVNRERRGAVQFHCDFSHTVAQTWNTPLDFLFIDGDHSEAATRQDFEDFEKHLTPDGVILFHDARLTQPSEQPWMGSPGSTAFVDQAFRRAAHPRWKITDESGSIVVLQRR
jgi:predicted O-methyltransferase YrrM